MIQENIPLAPLTTFKIGGPARFFVDAATTEDVIDAIRYATEKGLALFVLGGGSNILVSDSGFDGLVIRVALKGISRNNDGGDVLVTAQAGEDWDQFVAACVADELTGIECLSGIPGFVGGTPVQNVGAYGQDVSESIVSVRCIDRESLEVLDLPGNECGFSYRTSIFNTGKRDRYVVLSVTFALLSRGKPKIAYQDLRSFFGGRQPSLGEVREAVLQIRAGKSMVIDPTDPNSKSAGSFFKNPIVELSKLDELSAKLRLEIPNFPAGPGHVKIPAAWLIEQAGIKKGFVYGNAGVSTMHSLAIINRGNATAEEIVALKTFIANRVEDRFGIALIPEPLFIGFAVEKT